MNKILGGWKRKLDPRDGITVSYEVPDAGTKH